MIAYFEKFKKVKTQTHSQEEKNQTIIPRFLNRLWPRWVSLQSSPTSPLFNLHESPDTFTNVSQRQWVYLTAPGSEHYIQIDPQGLLTPSNQPFSLDVWVSENGSALSLSQLSSIEQSFDYLTPSLTTTSQTKDLHITLNAVIIPLPQHEDIACQTVSLKNTGNAVIDTSLYIAIRPYTPEGLTTLHHLSYHSHHAFLANQQLALVVDKKPDNILCLPFDEGDCIEHLKRWTMILQAKCPLGLASGIAEYKLTLNPGEKKEIVCKIPLFTAIGTDQTKDKLITTISQIKSLNLATEKERIYAAWEKEIPQSEWILPDSELQTLLQKNHFHLASHSDSHHNKPLMEQIQILGVQSLLNPSFRVEKPCKEIIKSLTYKQYFELSVLTSILIDHFQKNPQEVSIIPQILGLEKIWKQIITHIPKKHLMTLSTQALFWLHSSAQKLSIFCEKEQKTDMFSKTLLTYAKSVLALLNQRCDTLEKTRIFQPIVPISPSEWTDARLIEALCAVYPLDILDAYDSKVTATLTTLEKTCVLANGIVYNQMDPTGLCTHQNARLAQIYVARKDPKAFVLLDWLQNTASPAGTWPGAFHPIHHVGCDGEGHSRETMIEFLKLIRAMCLQETDTTLHITPFLPPKWLEKGLTFSLKNLPTRFGIISIEAKQTEKTLTYTLTTQFHKKPSDIKISAPGHNTATLSEGQTTCTLVPL